MAKTKTRSAPQAGVDIYRDGVGQWRWRVQAGNREVVSSGEGYTRRADAVRGFIDAVRAMRAAVTYVAANGSLSQSEQTRIFWDGKPPTKGK